MKKVFFIFLLSLTFSTIIAQDLKMGLFLSPSINSINTNDFSSDKKKIGFNYGYAIEYSFTENHSIESGFEISKKWRNRQYKLQVSLLNFSRIY